MKRIFILSLALAITASAMAQDETASEVSKYNPLNPAMMSLSIAPDARGGAMGDVGAATEPDEVSQYWNPAKYAFAYSRSGISLNYTPWLRKITTGINIMNAAGYYKFGYDDNQAVSASLTYFSLGEVTVINQEGAELQVINPMEMAFDVGYSRMLSPNFSMGVVFRYLHSAMTYTDSDNKPSNTFAADIAAYYEAYPQIGYNECKWAWGLNVSNVGGKVSYDGGTTSQFLPARMRLGTSFTLPLDDYNLLSISADADKYLIPATPKRGNYASDEEYQKALKEHYDMNGFTGVFKSFSDAPRGAAEELEEINWGIGAEYTYDRRFFLRAGYHHEHENKGGRKYFTFGAGIALNVFHIDASYVMSSQQTSALDQTLRFTLGFDLEGLRDMMGKRR